MDCADELPQAARTNKHKSRARREDFIAQIIRHNSTLLQANLPSTLATKYQKSLPRSLREAGLETESLWPVNKEIVEEDIYAACIEGTGRQADLSTREGVVGCRGNLGPIDI